MSDLCGARPTRKLPSSGLFSLCRSPLLLAQCPSLLNHTIRRLRTKEYCLPCSLLLLNLQKVLFILTHLSPDPLMDAYMLICVFGSWIGHVAQPSIDGHSVTVIVCVLPFNN